MTKTLNKRALGALLLTLMVLVSVLLPVTVYAAQAATTNRTSVKVYQKPSSSSKVLKTISKKGTSLSVDGESGSYYKVTYSGTAGYVRKSYVTLSKTASGSTGAGEGMYLGRIEIDGLKSGTKEVKHDVVIAKDNAYYLDRGPDGKKNVNGAIFMDFRNQDPNRRRNLILYGHRMNDGSMFAALLNYGKSGNPEKYNTVKLTYLAEERTYEVIAAGMVNIKDNNNYISTQFKNDTEFLSYLNKSLNDLTDMTVSSRDVYKAYKKSGYTPSAKDQILTLSTCVPRTMSGYADLKWIVLCRMTATKKAS